MKNLLSLGLALSAAAAFAAPTISNQSVAYDPVTRNLKVAYTLSEKAVVTADFLVGGVSIGVTNFLNAVGDLNRTVKAGDRAIYWRPHRDWPGHVEDVTVRVTAWPADNPPDYLVADLRYTGENRYYVSAEAIPFGISNDLYKTEKMVFRKIPAKGIKWRMGAKGETGQGISGDYPAMETVHWVTLTENYYMGIYQVTKYQHALVTGGTPSGSVHDLLNHIPPEHIYFSNVRGTVGPTETPPDTCYVGKMRLLTGIATADIPTDAQWEFACRAGTSTAFNNGKNLGAGIWDPSPNADEVGWVSKSANQKIVPDSTDGIQPVGYLKPNNWGLYDMHGNLQEWCRDWYAKTPYAENSEVENPTGPTEGTERVTRGSDCGTAPGCARSASRNKFTVNTAQFPGRIGYRLMCGAGAY